MTTEIIQGDCLEEMRKMADNSISAVVTDPPYGLHFMGKDWDKFKAWNQPNPKGHCIKAGAKAAGEYDPKRDDEFQAFIREVAIEALRIVKPGGHLLMFGSPRRHHRQMSGLEDAGWEIRDCIFWCFGSGFPKSHNFGCKCTGDAVPYNHVQRESESKSNLSGLQAGIQDAALLVQKEKESPLQLSMSGHNAPITPRMDGTYEANCFEQQGQEISITGNETRKESSLEGGRNLQEKQGELHRSEVCEMPDRILGNGQERRLCDGASISDGETLRSNSSKNRSSSSQRSQYSEQSNRESGTISEQSDSQDCGMGTCQKCGGLIAFKGYGTALKPAYEPIIMAMKPLDGTFAQNAQKWGQAGINIDGCRIPGSKPDTIRGAGGQNGRYCPINAQGIIKDDGKGRWPANVIFDEEAGAMLDEQSGPCKTGDLNGQPRVENKIYGKCGSTLGNERYYKSDAATGASRFFYCAKASSRERNEGLEELPLKEKKTLNDYVHNSEGRTASKSGAPMANNHPTVKPLKLMEYLIRLVMPPKDGILLDPFAGSGTTILAAKRLGFNAIGIEKQAEYCELARARLASYSDKPKTPDLIDMAISQ